MRIKRHNPISERLKLFSEGETKEQPKPKNLLNKSEKINNSKNNHKLMKEEKEKNEKWKQINNIIKKNKNIFEKEKQKKGSPKKLSYNIVTNKTNSINNFIPIKTEEKENKKINFKK